MGFFDFQDNWDNAYRWCNGNEPPAFHYVAACIPLVVLALIIAYFSYTYGIVLGILAMADSSAVASGTSSGTRQPLDVENQQSDNPTQPLLGGNNGAQERGAATEASRPRASTSNITYMVRELRLDAGWLSRFRGFGLFIVIILLVWIAYNVLSGFDFVLFRNWPFIRISELLVYGTMPILVVSGLMVNLTQFVIRRRRDSDTKSWYRYLLDTTMRRVVELLPATLIYAFVIQLAILIPLRMYIGIYIDYHNEVYWNFACCMLGAFLCFLLVIPAATVLVRIHASLLHANIETLVPIDRSLITRTERGHTTVPAWLDTWEGIDAGAWKRIYKLYGKILIFGLAILMFFTFVVFLEGWILSIARDQQCRNPRVTSAVSAFEHRGSPHESFLNLQKGVYI